MRIDNLKVYDLDESLAASGFAMRTQADSTKQITDKPYKSFKW